MFPPFPYLNILIASSPPAVTMYPLLFQSTSYTDRGWIPANNINSVRIFIFHSFADFKSLCNLNRNEYLKKTFILKNKVKLLVTYLLYIHISMLDLFPRSKYYR